MRLILFSILLFNFIFVSAKENELKIKVTTELGEIKGSENVTRLGRRIYSFRGIRYAEPPIGQLRFKTPVPVKKWNEIFDATKEGPACPQPSGGITLHPQSEDCLRLNIYTTKLQKTGEIIKKLPVIVFIHSGGYYVLSGQSTFLGPDYLLDQDVVLITINYRLGTLGFLSTGDSLAPGNLGLRDQVIALKWIKKHISHFGGDENSVTLVGCNSGSWSITTHLVSPMTKNLFHRVILSSGSAIYQSPLPNHQKELAIKQAKLLDCPFGSTAEIINCLNTKNASAIVNTLSELFEWGMHPILLWSPVVEKEIPGLERYLTGQPADLIRQGKFHHVPMIVGITQNEFGGLVARIVEEAEKGTNEPFDDLNTNWTRIAPILVWYERNSRRSNDISAAFKEFYFHGKPIDLNNWRSLSYMLGDAVGYQAHSFVNLVSQFSSQPVYYYKFTYQGRFSHENWSNGTAFGVCHHDDLFYLFYDSYFPYFNKTDPEIPTLERMTAIYGNFAKTGTPIPKNHKRFENVAWERFTTKNKKYLDIGNDLVMKTGLYADRMQEWDKHFNV